MRYRALRPPYLFRRILSFHNRDCRAGNRMEQGRFLLVILLLFVPIDVASFDIPMLVQRHSGDKGIPEGPDCAAFHVMLSNMDGSTV
jgi:hypothetical protein